MNTRRRPFTGARVMHDRAWVRTAAVEAAGAGNVYRSNRCGAVCMIEERLVAWCRKETGMEHFSLVCPSFQS